MHHISDFVVPIRHRLSDCLAFNRTFENVRRSNCNLELAPAPIIVASIENQRKRTPTMDDRVRDGGDSEHY